MHKNKQSLSSVILVEDKCEACPVDRAMEEKCEDSDLQHNPNNFLQTTSTNLG